MERDVMEQRAGLLPPPPPSVGECVNRCVFADAAATMTLTVNEGHDDEMHVCGYRATWQRRLLTALAICLSGGALRLLFHWMPVLYLRARCVRSAIADAQYVLIEETYNDTHRQRYVKRLRRLTADAGGKGLSVHLGGGSFRPMAALTTFTYKKVTYVWDADGGAFAKLRGLDAGVDGRRLRADVHGLCAQEARARRAIYGRNAIDVRQTPLLQLLFLEVLNPFYVFQAFSFVLWFADNYYLYAAAILAMSVCGVGVTVAQTRRHQRHLHATVHTSDVCMVRRRGVSESIASELLVPGDVLEIPAHGCVMHCDALLLAGNCILNESMLTGESVPVTKTPWPPVDGVQYDATEHARHTLFCGTRVLQTRYFGNEKVLAVVVRTGYATSKGALVRAILHPPPADHKFETDSYKFVALLAAVAGVGFAYTVWSKTLRGVAVGELLVEALDLITIVVPPALPAAMTVGRMYAQRRLQCDAVFCMAPRTINVAGSVDCVCFDKTGTLTMDGLDLLCVVPVRDSPTHFAAPITDVATGLTASDLLMRGLAACHSLTMIDARITGDPLDVKMFESTRWSIDEPDVAETTKFDMIFPTVFTPPDGGGNNGDASSIAVIREFPFSSSAQRMGVIVRQLGGAHFEFYAKGAPEVMLNYVRADSVPPNFADVLERYTLAGYRVIAMTHARLLRMSYARAQKVARETIERDMTLLGLIVLENRLKADTTPCVAVLNDARIRVVMVTGDNVLTAVSVARDCGIVAPTQSVIGVHAGDGGAIYYTLTAAKDRPPSTTTPHSAASSVVSLPTLSETIDGVRTPSGELVANNYRFAITGKVWAVVRDKHPDLVAKLVTRGSVFARMAPDQKQQLVQELQALGYYVAMCGDGANDCGALKAAHAGISLSEAESSVASPFTSPTGTIACVLSVVREGRAALVTSFGIFKYMAAYSLCQFASVLILYDIESNLTDMEFLYIDLCIISIFAFFFGRTAAYGGRLVRNAPQNSLVSVAPVLSLVLQMALAIAFQVAPFVHLRTQPDYTPFNATAKHAKDAVGCVENYTVFTASSFQYIILAIVFSKGAPYRASIFSNIGLMLAALALTAFSVYLALDPAPFIRDHFELVMPDDWSFRVYVLAYAAANALLAIIVELLIVDRCALKTLRNVDAAKRRHLAVERELQSDIKWPPLTPLPPPSSSAICERTLPTNAAEFTVEHAHFDKNHVLNSFYAPPPTDGDDDGVSVDSFRTAPNTPFHANGYQMALNGDDEGHVPVVDSMVLEMHDFHHDEETMINAHAHSNGVDCKLKPMPIDGAMAHVLQMSGSR